MDFELNKWAIVLSLIGLFISIISTIRWFFLYPDPSQFLIGVGVGVVIIGYAYIYNWMKLIDKKLNNVEMRLDTLVYPSGD